MLYYAENLNVTYRRDLSDKNLEAIWIQVNFSSATALFSVVYRAPDDNDFFDRFQKQLGKESDPTGALVDCRPTVSRRVGHFLN